MRSSAGTSSTARSYLNTSPYVGAAYYRLRQVDISGKATYSHISSVRDESLTSPLAVFPNPSRGAATLVGAVPGTAVRVFDATGHAVFSTNTDAQGRASVLPAAGLAAGIYVVRAGSQSTRLVVE